MPRTVDDARRWSRLATELLVKAADLDEVRFNAPSALPGWSRKHVVAHVAANADALCNLVHWASTGEPTPMYSSPKERAAQIENGAKLPACELLAWLRLSADILDTAMDALDDTQWQSTVVTAQGRPVPATELPWMRSREVCIHAVDLAIGVSFANLPDDFLAALCDDVVAKRAAAPGPALVLKASGYRWELHGQGEPTDIAGELHEIAAYLTGRAIGPSATSASTPALGPWL